jgi:hypothetical protein
LRRILLKVKLWRNSWNWPGLQMPHRNASPLRTLNCFDETTGDVGAMLVMPTTSQALAIAVRGLKI